MVVAVVQQHNIVIAHQRIADAFREAALSDKEKAKRLAEIKETLRRDALKVCTARPTIVWLAGELAAGQFLPIFHATLPLW